MCWLLWCYTACKQTHNLAETIKPDPNNPPELSYDVWTTLRTNKNGSRWLFAKRQCMHYQDQACVTACPVSAMQKQPNGAVTYDTTRCFGCRYYMVAYPFGIPTFEWDTTVPWIRKCTFCDDRQAQGLQPARVDACTTGALKYGDRDELIAEAHSRIHAAPAKYVNHVFEEKEVGWTSW